MGRIVSRDIEKAVNLELLIQELTQALGSILITVRPLEDGKTRIALLNPSSADIITATQIAQAHDANGKTEAQQTFATIRDLVLGSVGKSVTDLTTAERWALLAGLLYQNRALAPDMTVRHPRWWIAKQDTEDDN